jgi:hypothetical protein
MTCGSLGAASLTVSTLRRASSLNKAAEKALKGILLSRNLTPPFTHSLSELCRTLRINGRLLAHAHSDVDLIIVARSKLSFVERFRDFLDIVVRFAPTDVIVYTPEEWRGLQTEPNPLLSRARRECQALVSYSPSETLAAPSLQCKTT